MTSPKGNGSGFGLPKWLQVGLGIGALLVGMVVGAVGMSKSNGKADVTYADLVDERIEHLTTQLETLTTAVDQHIRLDMHPGAKAVVAEIRGTLQRLDKGMDRLEKQMEKMQEQLMEK